MAFWEISIIMFFMADNILCHKCMNNSDKENVSHTLGESGLLDKVGRLDLGIGTILSKEFCFCQ